MLMKTDAKYITEGDGLLDLSKPSLQALSHILRNRDLWPEGFVWDYNECTKCAMGMAHALWNKGNAAKYMEAAFMQTHWLFPNVSHKTIGQIFCNRKNGNLREITYFFEKEMCFITPENIADAIDIHLGA